MARWFSPARIALLSGAVTLAMFLTGTVALAADRMNVLFIAIDDLNDWVSPLGGYPNVQTPNLQRLANLGVTFTRAYCASPACNPSRTAVMTGIRPSTSGVYNNNQAWRPVMKDVVTLPQHFARNGYEAIGAGKIFHSAFEDPQSWSDYQLRGKDPVPPTKIQNDPGSSAGGITWGPTSTPDDDMADFQTANYVIRSLSEKHKGPFFLACGIFRPHLPWNVPQKYYDLYPLDEIVLPEVRADDLDDVPQAGIRFAKPAGDQAAIEKSGNWKRAIQAYLACITFADRQLGRVLDAYEASPDRDQTIVVLWSDHGWHLGEKQHWRKFALWEEATRVPLMFVVPGMTQPGSKCDRTVDLTALYPTLAELSSLPVGKQLDGRSLVPLLKNPQAEWDFPAVMTHLRGNHAVRSEDFRYIRYADGSEELYDHAHDPQEFVNLATDAKLAATKADLARWLPESNAPDAPQTRKLKKGEE